MEPISAISLIGTIAQLLDGTVKLVGYVNKVKKAPQSRAMLAMEATTLLGLLTSLKYRIEQAESEHQPWYIGVQSLGDKFGPLVQLNDEMKTLNSRLEPRFGGSLAWPFSEPSIKDTLRRIESLKSHIGLVLQDDNL